MIRGALAMFLLAVRAAALFGQEPLDAAGQWEGAILLPAAPLPVQVNLERAEAEWQGTISIPAQGVRRQSLSNLQVTDRQVAFLLSNLPGAPQFKGEISANGKSMAGEFTQAEQTFPFKLKRGTAQPGPGFEGGVPGQGLTGLWQGSLESPKLRLRLTMTTNKSGMLVGTLRSLDQGGSVMPVERWKLLDKTVTFQIPEMRAEFQGALSNDGAEISGRWRQGGQASPLVFKRLAHLPELSQPRDP